MLLEGSLLVFISFMIAFSIYHLQKCIRIQLNLYDFKKMVEMRKLMEISDSKYVTKRTFIKNCPYV